MRDCASELSAATSLCMATDMKNEGSMFARFSQRFYTTINVKAFDLALALVRCRR
jgi:hypothetical protein